jgi:ParB-like chromosome segregation protein Spo0J
MTTESPTCAGDHEVPALDADSNIERFDFGLQLHHLCTLFPPMSGAEFDELKADIRSHGLRQPIVIHEGMILDGANRYRACKAIGLKPTTIEFDGDDAASYVLSANLHRRHLTPGQQAAIVASAQDWSKAHMRGGDGSNQHAQKEGTGNVAGLQTVADRAAQSGASERTQRMADKVAKQSPDLAKKVAHGEVSLPKAVKQITASAASKPCGQSISSPGTSNDAPRQAHLRDGGDTDATQREHDETASPATRREPVEPAASVDEDAFGDFNTLAELEAAQKEIDSLLEQITALTNTDTAAELAKEIRTRQGVEARLQQEMNKIAQLDKHLRKLGKLTKQLRDLLGVESNSQIVGAVRALKVKVA